MYFLWSTCPILLIKSLSWHAGSQVSNHCQLGYCLPCFSILCYARFPSEFPTFCLLCSDPSLYLSHLMTKPTKWLCAQRRLRSAWASAQSDQSSLCTHWVAKDPSFLHADSEDLLDWADAKADLSLHWAHIPLYWFCIEVAYLWMRWL